MYTVKMQESSGSTCSKLSIYGLAPASIQTKIQVFWSRGLLPISSQRLLKLLLPNLQSQWPPLCAVNVCQAFLMILPLSKIIIIRANTYSTLIPFLVLF